jgi:hypothetical protein
MQTLLGQIKLWLWQVCNQCRLKGSEPHHQKALAKYTALFETIRDLAPRTTVVTTNYDVIFESLASYHDIPCAYPVSNPVLIPVMPTTSDYLRHLVAPSDGNAIIVCKLHGSLNYFAASESEKLFIVDQKGSDAAIGQTGCWSPPWPAILAFDAIVELRKTHAGLVPEIIPPTYAKLTGSEWLRSIWKRAFSALRTARTILVIGYSMPSSDGFMRALFQAAFASRDPALPVPTVHLVDPSEKTRERYSHLFGNLLADRQAKFLRDLTADKIHAMLVPP